MKKTMIALAAVASIAFVAKGDNDYSDLGWSGTSFEGYSVGATFNPNHDDDNTEGGKKFWNWGTDNIGDSYITNSADIGSYSGGHPAHAPNTTTSNYVSNAKALVLDTEGERFYRYMNSGDHDLQAIGSGIYFDSVVQFTASSDAPQIAEGDKLVVWLHGIDADDTVTPAITGSTNLVITAGYLKSGSNAVDPTNYIVTVNGSTPIEADTWHRLTIKAIQSIGTGTASVNATIPGFVVFIDGVAVTNPDEKGVAASAYGNIAGGAPTYWKARNALFPSMVNTPAVVGGEEVWTLQAVGFAGTGKIDDIYFTETAPEFTAEGKGVTLTWADDSGITNVTYQIGSGAVASAVNGAFIEMGENTQITINAFYDEVNGYGAGEWVLNEYAELASGTTYRISGPGAIEIVSVQNAYEVDGVAYSDLEQAIYAAQDAQDADPEGYYPVKMVGNVLTDHMEISAEGEFTLDLHGKCLLGNDSYSVITLGESAEMTIIDSVGGGYITNAWLLAGGKTAPSIAVDGSLTIGDESDTKDQGAMFASSVFVAVEGSKEIGTLDIVRGKFLTVAMDYETIYGYKHSGTVITDEGTYFLVEPRDVGTYEITIDQGEGTSLEVVQGSTPLESGDEVEEGAPVTLTAELEADYKNLVVTTNGVEVVLDSEGEFTFIVRGDTTIASYATELNKPAVTVSGNEHVEMRWKINDEPWTNVAPGTLTEGDSLTFRVEIKDADYGLVDVKINGVSQGAGGEYPYGVITTEEAIAIVIETTSYSSDKVMVSVSGGDNVASFSWTTNDVTFATVPSEMSVGTVWSATWTAESGYQFEGGSTTWTTNGVVEAGVNVVFVVPDAEEIPPTPTTVSVSVSGGANATAAWTIGGESAEQPRSIDVGVVWSVTYTANENYQFSEGVTEWTTNGTATAGQNIEITVPDATRFFDGGDGTSKFTIPSDKIAGLEAAVAAAGGKDLGAVCDTSSGLTYAQAYALGLYDETKGEFSNLPALNITVTGTTFTVAFTEGMAPKTGYTVTCKVYTRASLSTGSWGEPSNVVLTTGTTPMAAGTTAAAGFFRVEFVITGAEVTE